MQDRVSLCCALGVLFTLLIVIGVVVCVHLWHRRHPLGGDKLIRDDVVPSVLLQLKSSPTTDLFESLFELLGALHWYEKNMYRVDGVRVLYDHRAAFYDPKHGVNWFESLFEQINLERDDNVQYTETVELVDEWAAPGGDVRSLLRTGEHDNSVQHNHVLFQQHFRPLTSLSMVIADHVKDQFACHWDQHCKVVGLCYYQVVMGDLREGNDTSVAGDKRQLFIDEVRRFLSHQKDVQRCAFFVVTNDIHFFEDVRQGFPHHPVFMQDEFLLFDHLHNSTTSRLKRKPYERSRHMMLDCYLLSRCDAVCRISSPLSRFVSVINPAVVTQDVDVSD